MSRDHARMTRHALSDTNLEINCIIAEICQVRVPLYLYYEFVGAYTLEKAADTRLPSRPTRGNGRSKNQADMNDLFEELETDGDGEAELNTEPATEHRSLSLFMF